MLITGNGLGILLQFRKKVGGIFEGLIRSSVYRRRLWLVNDKRAEYAYAVASS